MCLKIEMQQIFSCACYLQCTLQAKHTYFLPTMPRQNMQCHCRNINRCCHILLSGDLESFPYVFFFSILNESIPKDEANQLLQDLLHEMSKFLLWATRRAFNPNLHVAALCIMYVASIRLGFH